MLTGLPEFLVFGVTALFSLCKCYLLIGKVSNWSYQFTFRGVTLIFQQFNILHQTQGRFNYFRFLIKPWLRISVLMLGSTFAIYLFPLSGSGPLWYINNDIFSKPCKQTNTFLATFFMYTNWLGPLTNYTGGFPV